MPRPLRRTDVRQLPQSGSLWQSIRASSLCQGLSPLGEVDLRSKDGEGEPAKGFSSLSYIYHLFIDNKPHFAVN